MIATVLSAVTATDSVENKLARTYTIESRKFPAKSTLDSQSADPVDEISASVSAAGMCSRCTHVSLHKYRQRESSVFNRFACEIVVKNTAFDP